MTKRDAKRQFTVQSGSLKWTGTATCAEEAVIMALENRPERLGVLVRIRDGWRWFYLDARAALKMAGYSVMKEIT